MTDTARDDIATITLSEHSRLLIASHRAMRADGKRLITATNGLQDRPPSDAPALGRAFAEIVTLIHDHRCFSLSSRPIPIPAKRSSTSTRPDRPNHARADGDLSLTLPGRRSGG